MGCSRVEDKVCGNVQGKLSSFRILFSDIVSQKRKNSVFETKRVIGHDHTNDYLALE